MTGRKKLLCGLVSIFIILCLAMPVSSTVVRAAPATEIWDWHDLHAITDNMSGSYVLMEDLHSGTAGYAERASGTANAGKGWQPIGTSANRFTGTFDGQGYEIRDLVVARPTENYAGLFGAVGAGGVIQNVAVVNAVVTGNWYAGGLAGANWGAVTSSYSTGSVTASYRAGGLAGFNSGTVSNSYSAATVSGGGHVGGLVAENYGTVGNCYSSGSVTGSFSVGGLVGENWGTVSNSFWDIDTSGTAMSAGGVGKTTAEMQDITTFSDAGWDIGTTSVADPTGGRPFLSWQIGSSPIWLIYEEPPVRCADSHTGAGEACFTTSHGAISDLVAVAAPSLPSVTFPHGMFKFKITGLANGQTVTLTIELPAPVPVGTVWWKYDNGQWHSLPNLSDNGDKFMVIQLTDGGTGDLDNIPGQITDPGGPGNPMTVGWDGSPISKAAVLAPWLALLAIIAGAGLLLRRRRNMI